jgi:broad specificity phosphatase PhoE
MKNIFFVRHGNTFEAGEPSRYIGSRVDVPLTAKGREQAEAVGKALKGRDCVIDVIYCGSQDRQRQSAQIIRDVLAPEAAFYEKVHALSEIDYGPWEGLTNDEIALNWPAEYEAWTKDGVWPALFVSREKDVREQIESFLRELAEASPACGVAVTSQGVLRQLRFLIDGTIGDEAKVKPGNYCEIAIDRAGMRIIRWNASPQDK